MNEEEIGVTLLEKRSPIIDLECTLKELERDIKFYRNAIFPKINVEASELKIKEYKDAINTLKKCSGMNINRN